AASRTAPPSRLSQKLHPHPTHFIKLSAPLDWIHCWDPPTRSHRIIRIRFARHTFEIFMVSIGFSDSDAGRARLLGVNLYAPRGCFAGRTVMILETGNPESRRTYLAKAFRIATIVLALLFLAAGARLSRAQDGKKIKIGFSIEAMKGERWQTDLNAFEARAKQLGAEVVWSDAKGDDDLQLQQVK